jgi:hypothetical protein
MLRCNSNTQQLHLPLQRKVIGGGSITCATTARPPPNNDEVRSRCHQRLKLSPHRVSIIDSLYYNTRTILPPDLPLAVP